MFAPFLALAQMTAPPPEVPPPPPIVIADCFVPGPYVLFFARDAATLDAEALALLGRVVLAERDDCGPFPITLTGHADRGERAGVDGRRIATVRDYFRAHGLGAAVKAMRARGSAEPRVVSTGQPEAQNRRVEIHVWVERRD